MFLKKLDSSKSLVAIWLFRTANSADDPIIDAMGRFITLFALATVVVGFLIRRGGGMWRAPFFYHLIDKRGIHMYIIVYIYNLYMYLYIYIYHMCVCIILVLYNYTNTFILYFAEHCPTHVDFNKGYCQRVGCLRPWRPRASRDLWRRLRLVLAAVAWTAVWGKGWQAWWRTGRRVETSLFTKEMIHDDYQKRNSYELWSRKNAGVECGHFCNHWPFVQLREQNKSRKKPSTHK